MGSYDFIPTDVKPPPGASKIYYVDAFSSEITFLLRKGRYIFLTDMMDDAIEVELNLSASKRTKQRNEITRLKEEEPQASTSQSNSDPKFNMIMKTMERMMDTLSLGEKNQMKDENKPQVRNPYSRRQQGPLVLQVMPRGKINPNEQQIRSPFQENLVDEEFI